MNYDYLHQIRYQELARVLPYLYKKDTAILEIGAGDGFQSSLLKTAGFRVKSIDLETSKHIHNAKEQILPYDGKNIPFMDNSFDVVFSSNVLEHVHDIKNLLIEVIRVTKPGGAVINILPSSSWRLFTSALHYLYLAKYLSALIYREKAKQVRSSDSYMHSKSEKNIVQRFASLLVPPSHGHVHSSLSELYFFSSLYWIQLFKDSGFRVDIFYDNNIFYSGYEIMGPLLPFRVRQALGRLKGFSSSTTYILSVNDIQ
jgi:2-polyprenyl-3-methyl-5-hydroxy-6-metoxy-1,4-benzoquinol methylase